MKSITVGIADFRVTNEPDAELITYALGSCIAVIVYDPRRKAGGMLHYMLPMANERQRDKPSMFADTGIPLLFEAMYAMKCEKGDLVVKVAGGGCVYDDHGVFDIGRRNYVILRKMFWKNGIMIAAEDVGGSRSRTVRLIVGSGRVIVRSENQEADL